MNQLQFQTKSKSQYNIECYVMYAIMNLQHLVPNQADGTDILTDDLYGKSIVFGVSECNCLFIFSISKISRIQNPDLHSIKNEPTSLFFYVHIVM